MYGQTMRAQTMPGLASTSANLANGRCHELDCRKGTRRETDVGQPRGTPHSTSKDSLNEGPGQLLLQDLWIRVVTLPPVASGLI